MPKLSILIPTLTDRAAFLARILDILRPQLIKEVELLINMDAYGQTTGAKRNALLHSAQGEYVSMVDDDDLVSHDYVERLLAGISLGVDVVAIRGHVFKDGVHIGQFIDTPYTVWKTVPDNGKNLFLRGVQHLDAIKREIALSAPFEDRGFGEDSRWSHAIQEANKCLTYHCVPEPVYEYWWRTDNLHR